jgi:hypothetical protein
MTKEQAWDEVKKAMIQYCEVSGVWLDVIMGGECQGIDKDYVEKACETVGLIYLD